MTALEWSCRPGTIGLGTGVSGDTSVTAMAEHLKKLEGFDWGNQTSPLKIVGGQKGAKAAARMFMAIVFGKKELSDVAELLEA